MSNLLLGFPNKTPTATFSGGSWVSSLPLDNLKDRRTLKLARSTDLNLASTQFDIDLGSPENISVFALRRHNMSLSAKVKLTGASDSGFTSIVYEGSFEDVFPPVYSSIELNWEDSNYWSGQLMEQDLGRFISLYLFVLPVVSQARYWRVELDDTTNGDGYIDVGSIFLSNKYVPANNYTYGASIQNANTTNVTTSQSGVDFFDQRKQKRVARFTLDNMSYSEGYQQAFDSTQTLGVEGEILVSLDPGDAINILRNSLVGRYTTTNPLSFPRYNQTSMPFEIQEII